MGVGEGDGVWIVMRINVRKVATCFGRVMLIVIWVECVW